MKIHLTAPTVTIATALALCITVPAAFAQTTAAKKSVAGKASKKPTALAEPAPPAVAGPEQIDAAERVYYGVYECEFKQTVHIAESSKYPSYVHLKHAKSDYLMKPVVSSTGAIRLEDVRNETLMVQVASKSMLLNVKTGQRVVDDCVSPKQRELADAARLKDSGEATLSTTAVAAPAPTK